MSFEEHKETPAAAPAVAVVTDSTTYLPAELFERHGIEQVSLYVGWGGELIPERDYTDLDAFYERLRESPQLPSTSQPSVGDFLAVYRPLAQVGRDIVSVHIAEGLSGTCQSAREAARILAEEKQPGTVHVHDGQTGAGGLGCLVLAAAEMAEKGHSAQDILAGLSDARDARHLVLPGHPRYLGKGGRIGAAQAVVGTALKIKPILTFGIEIAPVGRVRTHSRAIERMVDYLRELKERGASDWIVQHAQAPRDAERLCEAGRELFATEPTFCTEVGPVLGAHLGAGVLVGGMTRPG